jgi:L-malate glycosyltransferase
MANLFKKYKKKLNLFVAFLRFYYRDSKKIKEIDNFFFFPFYHVGGAERVHADILKALDGQKNCIFFTGDSVNNFFYQEFEDKNNLLLDINGILTKKKYRGRTRRKIIELINASSQPKVFGCNSLFFYETIPLLKAHVQCIDLIHAFVHKDEIGAEHWSLPLANLLTKRVFISKKAIGDLREQYLENNVSEDLMNRVVYIPNKVSIPTELQKTINPSKTQVIYVGRGSEEKRVHLIGAIAKKCIQEMNLNIEFTFIGDVKNSVPEYYHPFVNFYGEIKEQEIMNRIYQSSDVILISSSREGFPMAIMEGMAYGVIPVSTNVGDISSHVKPNETGFLIQNSPDENSIINDFVNAIKEISLDEAKRIKLSNNAYAYAKENFNPEKFQKAYRELFSK